MSQSNFRVIVIGGGPVGLATGHALAAAGIDYVILERQAAIVNPSGASVMLWPHCVRLFDQLGLLEAAEEVYMHLQTKTNTLLDGTLCETCDIFGKLEKIHGYRCMNFNRTELTMVLYNNLPDREKRVKTNSGLADIKATDNGVRVILEDGSVEEGSIVIGCDGVHSKTREILQRQRKAGRSAKDGEDQEEEMVASFQILYGRAPAIEGVPKYTFFETRGTGKGTQVVTGDSAIQFGLCRALPKPTSARKRYTDEEAAAFAEDFFDVTVATNLTFKELWPKCVWTRLVDNEEGFMKNWHHGRIVLVGDSAHKMTSPAGMGLNCGLQSSIFLVNELTDALKLDANPDAEKLDGVFSRYQEIRQREARPIYDMSKQLIRGFTWSNWMRWLVDQYLIPFLGMERVLTAKFSIPVISHGRLSNSISKKDKSGTIPWVN